MRKIGLFGGAFDPPHLGHLRIAETVQQALLLDEVIFIPSQLPPHKSKSLATGQQRLQMVQLAIQNQPRFTLSDIEFKREGSSYTIETVKAFVKLFPEAELFFLIGGDMIDYLSHWYKIDELVSLIKFVGVKRPSYDNISSYPVEMVEVNQWNVSSSMIRDKLRIGEDVQAFLPMPVLDYIKEHNIYGTE